MADRDPFAELGAVPDEPAAEDPFAALGAVEEPAEFVPTDQRPSAAASFPPHPDDASPAQPTPEKSLLERVGEGALGFAQGAGQFLGKSAPRYASAAGMYLADKALGNDRSFDEELRAATDASESVEQSAPTAAVAGQVTGALASAIGTGGFGTVKLGTQAAAKAGSALAARLGASGVMTAQQANAVRLGSAVAGLMTAGAAAGAQQAVVRKVDEAVASGDYKGLAETIVPAVLEDAAKGAAIDLGLGAAGAGISAGIRKLVEAGAGDWVSGRAFKAILVGENKKGLKLADKRIPGGHSELGRSMLDEGVVTPGASFDDMAERLGQKREDVGRELGELRKELDELGVVEDVVETIPAKPAVKPTMPLHDGVKQVETNSGDVWFRIPKPGADGTELKTDALAYARTKMDLDPELVVVKLINARQGGVGQGFGTRLYNQIADFAESQGRKMASDLTEDRSHFANAWWDKRVKAGQAVFDESKDRYVLTGRLPGQQIAKATAEEPARTVTRQVARQVEGPDGRELWEHIENRVLGNLRNDPILRKKVGKPLEDGLEDLKAYLLGDDAARSVSDPWRQRAVAAAAEAPTVAGNPRTAKVLSPSDDPFTMGRPKPAKVDQLVPAEAARKLNVDDPFRMGSPTPAVESATGQLVPGAARSALNVGDAFRMGAPEPPRRLSWEDITRLRMSMDKLLKWDNVPTNVTLEAQRDVRRALNEYWMDSAERAAAASGRPELVQRIKTLTSRYAKLSTAHDLVVEGLQARENRRFFSPSDHGLGVAGFLGAISSGGATLPALATGAATTMANKVARERGNQFLSGSLYNLSNRLVRTQERIQKAASLPRLLQNAAAVNSAAAGSTAASTPMMTPMLAEQREKRVSNDLRRAEALLDPESEENRELTGSLQALELEVGTDVAAAVRDKALQRAQFILDKAPPTPPPSVFDGEPKRELGDDDINTLHRYIEAVDDPEAALQRLGDGEATAEDLDTLGTLYPSMLKDFRTAAANTLSQMKNPPPYEDRLALADTLGIPLTADTDPMSVAYWQGVAVEGAAAAQERNAQNQAPVRGTKSYEQPADKVLSTADRIA